MTEEKQVRGTLESKLGCGRVEEYESQNKGAE